MSTYKNIVLGENGRVLLQKAKWCDNFGSKLRGFTFRRELGVGDGLVLAEKKDSKLATSIHMLFVSFDLAVIWVDDANEVVDIVLAKPWKLSYAPKSPARYVIEGHPDLLEQVQIGDNITFQTV